MSSINSLLGSTTSTLRISGLASGLDTDSIVKQLMQAAKIPVDKLNQNKQVLQWQQEDYRTINSTLRTFRDKVFTMKLQSTYLANTATSSNEGAFTASAGANAPQGSFTVTVNQLASGVAKGSQAALPGASNSDGTTKTLADQFGLSGNISFTLQGSGGSQTFNFDTSTATIYNVASEINAAKLGLSARYDSTSGRFFLNTTSTGSTAKIVVTGDDSNFLSSAAGDGSNALHLLLKGDGTVYSGQDASIDFGDTQNITSATNSVTVNGVTLNLKQGGGTTGTVTVSADTDAVFNSIKDFITSYNDTIDAVNQKLSETRYRDYLPLTDEQKEYMSEKQIDQWTTLARSGLLRNDSLLSSAVQKMRTDIYASVSGVAGSYNNLAALGITSGNYSEKGKLYIDETKLREAIQSDPQGIMDLFTKSSDNYNEKGIAARLYDSVNNAMSQIAAKAGSNDSFSLVDNSTIGKRLTEVDTEIETWETRLNDMETRYYKQFTAMEQALSLLNSQSAWIAQQLGTTAQY